MGKKEEGYSSSSFWQLMIAIPGSIIGFTLLISVLAHFLEVVKQRLHQLKLQRLRLRL